VSGATSSGNSGVSTLPQQNHQPTFLTEYPLTNETPSRSGLQEIGTPSVIQSAARSKVATGGLLKNGEAFVVQGNTLNYNLSVMPSPSTHVPAPTVEEPLNLDQNEGIVGCVLSLYFDTILRLITMQHAELGCSDKAASTGGGERH